MWLPHSVKLGGRELSASSDLDLIVIYHAPDADAPQNWFTKFTQRLITALSAPTGEGELYEVDLRLRPSGNSGPVATSLASFERYHNERAWTWEHMALTRLRPVTGDGKLQQRVSEVAREAISQAKDAEQRSRRYSQHATTPCERKARDPICGS